MSSPLSMLSSIFTRPKQLLVLLIFGGVHNYDNSKFRSFVDGQTTTDDYMFLDQPWPVSDTSTELDVRYQCLITNLWTSERQPNWYPDNARWEIPIIASHLDGFEVWLPDSIASHGFEKYVESGSVNELIMEILNGGSDTGDIKIGKDFSTNDSEETELTLAPLTVSLNHPLVSSVMMLGPSPDWFTGFYDFSPVDLNSNQWYGSFTIETYPFDAGTETGHFHMMGNQPENSHLPIHRFEPNTVPSQTNALLGPDGTSVPSVARWTCTLNEVLPPKMRTSKPLPLSPPPPPPPPSPPPSPLSSPPPSPSPSPSTTEERDRGIDVSGPPPSPPPSPLSSPPSPLSSPPSLPPTTEDRDRSIDLNEPPPSPPRLPTTTENRDRTIDVNGPIVLGFQTEESLAAHGVLSSKTFITTTALSILLLLWIQW